MMYKAIVHTVTVFIFLSFFSILHANDAAKIEDLKKRFAQYTQENESAFSEGQKAGVAALISVSIPLAFRYIMHEGRMEEHRIMLQRINDMPIGWLTGIACIAIDVCAVVYTYFKVDAACQHYQKGQEIAREIEELLKAANQESKNI